MNRWDRQPKESAPAYAAFVVYRDLGVDRSLAVVGKKLGKSAPLMERWSVTHDWLARVAAYEAHLDRIAQDAREKATAAEAAKWAKRREQQREREWELADQLAQKAKAMLDFPISRMTTEKDGKTYIIEPADWNFAAAARIVDTQAKLARLASEMETERTITLTPAQAAQMSDEQIDAELRKRGLL